MMFFRLHKRYSSHDLRYPVLFLLCIIPLASLGQSSLEIHQPQHQVYTGHKFSYNRGMANTNNDSGRLPLTHLRHKKQTNRAWNNHYQLNSSSSTSLNQLHSRLAHLGLESRPYFAQTKMYHTVQEGMNAFFNCKVENIYNQTVSWIRNNDGYMLYIGRTKFIDDDRFDLLPGNEGQADLSTSRGGVDAILRVRRVKDVDQGNFECQISTEPKLSKIFTLNVIVPNVKIIGDPEMHVEAGSSVALRCIVTNAMLRPKFVFWYRDKHGLSNSRSSYAKDSITITDNINKHVDGVEDIVISDLSQNLNQQLSGSNDGRSQSMVGNSDNRITFWNRNNNDYNDINDMDSSAMKSVSHEETVTSVLTIHEASSKHSGRYQCAPDNTRPAAINLHVIKDENAAGLQRESANHAEILSSFASHTILILSWSIYFFFASSFCEELT